MLGAYPQFCKFLQRVSGIVLSDDKKYLVESRILPIIEREKMSGLAQLVSTMESGKAPRLVQEVIDVMTINETYFFRDKTPFDLIADRILPALHAALPESDPIRIWSAACSTGQEPYTLAMIAEERRLNLRGRRIEIVATDVSAPVLARAGQAKYSTFEVERGLSPERIKRHFTEVAGGFKLNSPVKDRVSFRHLNLLSDYTTLGTFDLILCRNVLIYFNTAQKGDILKRLARSLRPTGYLLLGSSETLFGSGNELVAEETLKGCYRRSDAPTAAAAPSVIRKPELAPIAARGFAGPR